VASQGKGGKLKGGNYERKTAKLFTTWWQAGGLEGEFYRTPASGGLRWANRGDTIGDLVVPQGFVGTVECKDTESWKFKELFTKTIARAPLLKKKGKNIGKSNSPRTIGEFWYQTWEEAVRANKIPMLIFSKNYQKSLIVTPVNAIWNTLYKDAFKQWAVYKSFVPDQNQFLPYLNTVIMRFDKFLEIASPHMFVEDKD